MNKILFSHNISRKILTTNVFNFCPHCAVCSPCPRTLFISTPCLLTGSGASAVLGISCADTVFITGKDDRYNYSSPDGKVLRAKLYFSSEDFQYIIVV